MTKSEYMSNIYIGKHEKHRYCVGRMTDKDSDVEYSIVYGREELDNLLEGCWDWSIYDLTTDTLLIETSEVTARKEVPA